MNAIEKKVGKLSVICLSVLILLGGCKEEDFCAIPSPNVDDNKVAADIIEIDNFINSAALTARAHPTGIRYIINEPGNNNRPDDCSLIRVSYEGSLLNGTVFDETPAGITRDFVMSQLIVGWRIILPEIGEGGNVTFFLPSEYAYGNASPSSSIPAGSILIFTMDLIEVF